MHIVQHIQEAVVKALNETFGQPFTASDFQINQIKQEFKGDYSVVLFPLLKRTGLSPQALGEKLIEALQQQQTPLFKSFELIKGFLNIEISDAYWVDFLNQTDADTFGQHPSNGRKAMVEYSSPNTNKPLHLGHLRNNFLGWSIAAILKANGYEVYKSCIINDRGIHICK
ncbi:MAG TPA: arginine--tRNA ligase, partial [Ferruginibacter sp.]|nr:arginine--tRNA ligase [Ferruginibacter sp.]